MNVILTSFGSSGDINPFLAVGSALKSRGHQVSFISNEFYKAVIEEHGLKFYQVGTKEEYIRTAQSEHMFHPDKAFRFIVRELIIKYQRDYYYAIENIRTDKSIVISQSISPGPRIAHEKLSIPLISLNLQPFTFWSVFNPPVFSGFFLPSYLPYKVKKYILEMVDKHYIDKQYAPEINRFLSDLGLPSQQNFFSRWMYSPQLIIGAFPGWFGQPSPDWPRNTRLSGFIMLNNDDELPPPLEQFLEAGEPPLVFTAGSAMQHVESFFETAIAVTKALNRRAIFITSYSGQIPHYKEDCCFVCNSVPYQKLFPRVEAVIHHGGIGTIAHVIAAGKPQLVVPFAHDQPDNASRVERLGLGITVPSGKFHPGLVIYKLNDLLLSSEIRNNCIRHAKFINFNESMNKLTRYIEEFAGTCFKQEKQPMEEPVKVG
jgi:UDP:flavonoid glycosyltransferase YjiC (YdhE family)